MPAWILRISAILEIGVIFLGGTLIARFIGPRILPARLSQDANELFLSHSPDFIEIGAIVAADLLLRYGVMLGLALAFGWWHRRRSISGYGITTAGKPISFHILTGILIVLVGGFIPRLLIMLREFISLGSTPLDFEILFSIEWNFAFWVYMAVGSFILVPIVEELFFRGYVQTHLTEEFGVATGILMTALIFTFSHTKYFAFSVFSLGMLGSLLISSLILGFMRHNTGSLIPGTIGHGLSNLPTRGIGAIGMLILMLSVIIIKRQQLKQYALGLYETLSFLESPRDFFAAVLILIAVLVIVLLFRELLLFALIFMGLGAILIAFFEKRRQAI